MPSKMNSSYKHQEQPVAAPAQTKVMLVDDSVISRNILAQIFESDPSIEVVSSVSNGQMAVNAIVEASPDVVVLDIEMPIMDGLTALPLLLAKAPNTKILIFSGHSQQGADVSIQALYSGAAECLLKPSKDTDLESYHEDLLRIVKTLAGLPALKTQEPHQKRTDQPKNYELRDSKTAYRGKPEIIAIGSSTGGPRALFSVLKELKGLDIPIIITQHMPATFTSILAQHLSHNSEIDCVEAQQDMVLEAGRVYLAPGDHHMELIQSDDKVTINLNQGPKINYCRPAIDPMLSSAIKLYGEKVLGVLLTGMGRDGHDGCKELVACGGRIIAQNEQSSVIWGMPGTVAMAGLCSAVLPLNDIGSWIKDATEGKHGK